ncbi:MAG: hypothetical protein M3T96_07655 [Acidobacteriota bacterium]|nr:hypothetical protein [Acidobacteriota bacterium]
MQTLGLEENKEPETEAKKGFWRRQFQQKATKLQQTFDWSFGVILPVVCFYFDPIVFKNHGILEDYQIFADILSFVSVMAMAAWLIWGAKLKWANALLAGLFSAGSAIAFGIGVILFPFSVLGLAMLIGILGFTPLFTAVVFLRNSIRAYHAAEAFLERKVIVYAFLTAALFTFVVPSVISVEINKIKRGERDNHISIVIGDSQN